MLMVFKVMKGLIEVIDWIQPDQQMVINIKESVDSVVMGLKDKESYLRF